MNLLNVFVQHKCLDMFVYSCARSEMMPRILLTVTYMWVALACQSLTSTNTVLSDNRSD